MKNILPASFRFSWLTSSIAISLAIVMVFASRWQWSRYHYKKALVATYQAHSAAEALPFPFTAKESNDFLPVLHRKVELSGSYDYENQLIVINRRHASGPGHWLFTPFLPDGSKNWLLVSRGFIPFVDSNQESWDKYIFDKREKLLAVVQETVPTKSFITPLKPPSESAGGRQVKWTYTDIKSITASLPYTFTTAVYLQRLGNPPKGEFPAESISIRVPPSTHFGYAIEWLLLACASLLVAFLMQAFPRRKHLDLEKRAKIAGEAPPQNASIH